jgi:hypothetical protein
VNNVFPHYVSIKCECCGSDVFENGGIIVFIEDVETDTLKNAYFCCKGKCDTKLQARLVRDSEITTWFEISDLKNPDFYSKITEKGSQTLATKGLAAFSFCHKYVG